MKLKSLTDIGVKRKDNQDNYWSAILEIDGTEAGIVCLCDGMGGLNNGGLASRMVVEAVRKCILSGFQFRKLEDIIKQVNYSIYRLGVTSDSPMGTTCTTLCLHDGRYEIWHVGDSRCYLGRGDSLSALTTDHSALRKYGISKDNPTLYKKYRNSLTRCIGVKEETTVDYYSGEYINGDMFFLCSDGVWHYIQDYSPSRFELENIEDLVTKCISSGEKDNMTAGYIIV